MEDQSYSDNMSVLSEFLCPVRKLLEMELDTLSGIKSLSSDEDIFLLLQQYIDGENNNSVLKKNNSLLSCFRISKVSKGQETICILRCSTQIAEHLKCHNLADYISEGAFKKVYKSLLVKKNNTDIFSIQPICLFFCKNNKASSTLAMEYKKNHSICEKYPKITKMISKMYSLDWGNHRRLYYAEWNPYALDDFFGNYRFMCIENSIDITNNPIYMGAKIHIIQQLLTTVSSLHDNSILLGDCTDANVMLTADFNLRLIDIVIGECERNELLIFSPGFSAAPPEIMYRLRCVLQLIQDNEVDWLDDLSLEKKLDLAKLLCLSQCPYEYAELVQFNSYELKEFITSVLQKQYEFIKRNKNGGGSSYNLDDKALEKLKSRKYNSILVTTEEAIKSEIWCVGMVCLSVLTCRYVRLDTSHRLQLEWLDGMLQVDPEKRISIKSALDIFYSDLVRIYFAFGELITVNDFSVITANIIACLAYSVEDIQTDLGMLTNEEQINYSGRLNTLLILIEDVLRRERSVATAQRIKLLCNIFDKLSDKISDIHSVPRMLSDMLSPGNISYAMLIKQYQFCRWLIEKVNRYSLTSVLINAFVGSQTVEQPLSFFIQHPLGCFFNSRRTEDGKLDVVVKRAIDSFCLDREDYSIFNR